MPRACKAALADLRLSQAEGRCSDSNETIGEGGGEVRHTQGAISAAGGPRYKVVPTPHQDQPRCRYASILPGQNDPQLEFTKMQRRSSLLHKEIGRNISIIVAEPADIADEFPACSAITIASQRPTPSTSPRGNNVPPNRPLIPVVQRKTDA